MEKFIQFSRRLDYVMTAVMVLAAVVAFLTGHSLIGLGLGMSSVISYLSARAVLARWVLSRILLLRLKS